MSFHRSQTAFFAFITVIVGAVLATCYAHRLVAGLSGDVAVGSGAAELVDLSHLLVAIGGLLAAGLLLGLFFIFPLLRFQLREESKLRAMTDSLSKRSQMLERAALTDCLTGMQNRRYFDDALREYLEEFGRIGKPVGLMIIDLDHFKQVNDTHGHDVGDEVLRAVAACLKDMTRQHDVVARLGGEEFAIVAPNMDIELMVRFAERIRKAIAGMAVISGNVRLKVTTSVGLAVWDGFEKADDFFRRADQQLYLAKRSGRNRVCAAA